LEVAGLKEGQNVLEVGCGPGYFTIPAAKIVGPEGFVYALDVNPRAIKRVQKKIEKEGIKNARGILTNAASTGLPDGSINLAFVFGLRYIAGGLQNLMAELHRVLNTGGILSFERTRGSEKELIAEVSGFGFTYLNKRGRILSFTNRAQ
jgi:ubiquinone/menaquinone biosynthesis C-methylase UbiE